MIHFIYNFMVFYIMKMYYYRSSIRIKKNSLKEGIEMISILVAEDEHPIADLVQLKLEEAGYSVTVAYDGKSAADYIEKHNFDLAIFDIMLPKINGYELLEYIKPLHIPVIFLTAKGSLDDRVKGLNLGAEDYIVKPFEALDLLARIQVILRRYHQSETILTLEDLTMDCQKKEVVRNGVAIDLTPKEFHILELFFRNVDTTLFREQIYETVWEKDYEGEGRTVDLHIQRIRKKTGLKQRIKTIYGIGYRLC